MTAISRRKFVIWSAAGTAITAMGEFKKARAASQTNLTPSPLKFTRYYAGRTGKKIIRDRRFKTLLPTILPNVQLPYWLSTPLAKSLPTFFSLAERVVVDNHRWVSVQTAVAHNAVTRGLLWIDTAPREMLTSLTPTVIWANLITDGFTSQLYLYSDVQLSLLSSHQLPNNFKKHLGKWLAARPPHAQGPVTSMECHALEGTSAPYYVDQIGISPYFFRPA